MAAMHSRGVCSAVGAASGNLFPRQRTMLHAQQDAESRGIIEFIRRLIRKLRGKPAPPVPDTKTQVAGGTNLWQRPEDAARSRKA